MSAHSPPVLIVATSGRALAASAQAAGVAVVVLDAFADADTQTRARMAVRVGDASGRLNPERLVEQAERTCPPGKCAGVVYGSGFEATPEVLRELGRERTLFGNTVTAFEEITRPKTFFEALRRLGLAHPETRYSRPERVDGWLEKPVGGAGGRHIQAASHRVASNDTYFQRYAAGWQLSVTFIGDGHGAHILGVNEQWNTGPDSAPYRYAGAISDHSPSEDLLHTLKEAIDALAAHWALRGLNSIDLIVNGVDVYILEINPRPPASTELYDRKARGILFKQHLHPKVSELRTQDWAGAAMHAQWIVYADTELSIGDDIRWPEWCTDLPCPGTNIPDGAPVCTVHASGRDRRGVLSKLADRVSRVEGVFAMTPTAAHFLNGRALEKVG